MTDAGNMLVRLMGGVTPVFMNVETTGVRDSDSISALVLKSPLCAVKVLHTPLAVEQVEFCLRFLLETRTEYDAAPKISTEGLRQLLLTIHADSGRPILPLTYNVDFQQRFLDRILDRNDPQLGAAMLPAMDLSRLAWCLKNTGDWFLKACTDLNALNDRVSEVMVRQKGTGYKQTLPAWGILLPNPLRPEDKPRLMEALLLKLMGLESTEQLCAHLGLTSNGLFHRLDQVLSTLYSTKRLVI